VPPCTPGPGPALNVLGAAVTAGCGAGGDAEGEPSLGTVPVVNSDADIVLPLDAYRYTNRDYLAMMRAHSRLTADCMRRFGVEFPYQDTSGVVAGVNTPDFDHANSRRYGLLDPESAAVRGYLPQDAPAEETPTGKGAAGPAATEGGFEMTPQIMFLLKGKAQPEFATAVLPTDSTGRRLSDDGCLGEAERTLAGGNRAVNVSLADLYASEAHRRAQNDSRLTAAMTAWSTCMRERGYDYASSWGPNDREWPRPPGAEEIATAGADVQCKRQTNLAGTWLALETAYQHREIDRHAQELAELRRYLQNVVRNSARVGGG
jgi:hypothetical protein